MTETPHADALLTELISGTEEPSFEGFATLTDPHEREKALYILSALLTDPDPSLQWRAIKALGVMGDQRAVEPLINSLDDIDSSLEVDLFGVTASALAALGDRQAIPPLLAHDVNKNQWPSNRRLREFNHEDLLHALIDATDHHDELVRCSAINALGSIDEPRSISALIRALKDESYRVSVNSVRGLAALKAVDAVPSLILSVSDHYAGMRWEAAEALGKLGDPQAIPALLPLLSDKDKRVRFDAAFALGKFGHPAAIDLIRAYFAGDRAVNLYAIDDALQAFQRLGLPAVPLLFDVTDYVLVRVPLIGGQSALMLIAEIFAEQGDPAALPVLEQMLGIEINPTGQIFLDPLASTKNEAVRQAAQKAIDAIKARMKDYDD
jgi:HEAT repeat protein